MRFENHNRRVKGCVCVGGGGEVRRIYRILKVQFESHSDFEGSCFVRDLIYITCYCLALIGSYIWWVQICHFI